MNNWIESVEEYHRVMHKDLSPDKPTPMSLERFTKRHNMMKEEFKEYKEALYFADVVHEIGDVIYVALGFLRQLGVDPDAVLTAIHAANMTKTPNDDGKATKGPDFKKCNMAEVLDVDPKMKVIG
jgi:predicted HAD superfamily Cof-like phosphohydrolase